MAFTTNFKPPKGSGRLEKHARRVEHDKKLAEAYADVDQRDQSICWVTGRYTLPGAVMAENRREHHHLKGRRVRPEWVTKAERIITVCKEAHDLITGGFIDVEGDDARKPIFFHWREDMMRGQSKPFRIIGKRTAA